MHVCLFLNHSFTKLINWERKGNFKESQKTSYKYTKLKNKSIMRKPSTINQGPLSNNSLIICKQNVW